MQLRLLLEKFNPGLAIDTELAALESGVDLAQDSHPGVEDGAAREDYEWNEASSNASPNGGNVSLAAQKDGMAILPSINSGYLGRSSGSEILQEVAALLPPSTILSPSDELHPHPAQPTTRGDTLGSSRLVSSVVINTLIDGYFRLYNTSYPILHEATFRNEVANQDRVCTHPTWRIIYYMVLAIGSWLLENNITPEQCPFYSAARSRISMQVFEAGTTRTVQGLLLMGNYLQKRDRPNTGYSLIGLAQRIAFGIGLHRERPLAEDKIALERHRQLFWIVYCFDSGFSITTGRPMADCDNSSVVPTPVNYPTTYSALIAQAQLVKIANGIHHEFLGAKTANQKMEYQLAEIMAQKLDAWRDNLPEYFTSSDVPPWFMGPRSIVLWKEQNLRILLWRGTKKVHPYLPSRMDARGRCLDAAMETIQSISSFVTSSEGILHPGITCMSSPLYQPLDTTKAEIRLIEILPEGFSLITVPLDDAPKYAALSYVWGDPKDQETIVLQGRDVQIGTNLASFLGRIRRAQQGHPFRNWLYRHYQLVKPLILTIILQRSICAWTNYVCVSLHDPLHRYYQVAMLFVVAFVRFLFRQRSRSGLQAADTHGVINHFWADAICINQQDIKERTQQVQLMGQIFGSAVAVYSWIGPRDHSLAFDSIKRLARICRLRGELETTSLWWYPSLWRQTDKSDESRFRSKAWNAIDDLFSDRYWNRVWIFQEVVLARQMHLMSPGASTLSWHDLQVAARGLQNLSARLQEREDKVPFFMSNWAWLFLKMFPDWSNVMLMIVGKEMSHFSDQIIDATPVISISSKLRQEAYDKGIKYIKGQVEKIQWWLSLLSADFTATDPRDQVYGTLAITRLPIVPDYTKTVSEVYMDYAARWIKAHCFFRDNPLLDLGEGPQKYSPLAFLSFAGAHGVIPSLDLPSWVPNFKVKRNHERHVFGRKDEDYGPAFRQDGRNDPYIVPGTRSLHEWGFQLELISAFTSSTHSAKFDNADRFKGILKYGSFVSDFMSRHPQYVSGTSSFEATAGLLAQPHGSDITNEAAICYLSGHDLGSAGAS
ncbi:hypothetical protein CEP54_009940 [Fusarium duplospermum]|uniref:Xylanolytic transcriptional activator regulatory domain-containing protein n=1 Tax=Fusarium duplospermum TaxID=1325734 RepID=A0A428PMS1_9HYPO|nr:hypothetical protein CEP54_009940 [Fusarium duplospermum]